MPDVSPSLNAGHSWMRFIRARAPVCAFEVLVASPRSAGSYSKQGDPRDALLYRPASDVPGVPRAFFWGLAWIVSIFASMPTFRLVVALGTLCGLQLSVGSTCKPPPSLPPSPP